MRIPSELYRPSLALLTDLYQLTMAHGYYRSGLGEHEAVFHLGFRRNPFQGGFTIACGLAWVIDLLESLRFDAEDLAYLRGLRGGDGEPLFDEGFLAELGRLRLRCDVDAVPEGSVVFPHEPLLRVRGPIVQAQLFETALLNIVNFQTLIATKAARVALAAAGEPVLEFGLRRAQGVDGALAASRAAYLGGCHATSNVLAGRLFGIPVRGTHAHSWVMAFDDERAAFQAYARAMPNNCVFLVDTYDTLAGVDHAIEVGRWLRAQGRELIGIRLDSGDLAYLSLEARRKLDAAGFPAATIVASNDLDEHIIESLKRQGAAIAVWGVGTKLITAYDEPALGGVYKLSAIRAPGEPWRRKVKLSEQAIKTSTPGILQVRRYRDASGPVADLIHDVELGLPAPVTMIDPLDPTRRRILEPSLASEELLKPIFRAGRRVYEVPPLEETRAHAAAELASFHAGIRRFVNPHRFPVGLERSLHEQKTRLILEARGAAE
jgi:nicotinate phosphoribosyltransferase